MIVNSLRKGQFLGISLITFFLILGALISPSTALAHPPSNIQLSYVGEKGVLSVEITHRVGNPSNHYVDKISVFKNGEFVLEKSYDEQDASNGSTYRYELAANNGDKIEVKATCNRFGNISRTIEVKGVPAMEPVLLQAQLTADMEVQGVKEGTPDAASGLAIALLDRKNNELKFSLVYKGLSGRPSMAHFHRGKKGEEGPPVRTIFGKSENEDVPPVAPEGNSALIKGVWNSKEDQQLTDERIDALLSGEIYINIHTELNPAGEIRAQLVRVNG